jgi:nucleoside-diphosphate-sugar epimerase
MLEHLTTEAITPQRAVILGAGGFIGGACMNKLQSAGIDTVGITRTEVELMADGAADHLCKYITETDALVVVSAKAPVKDNAMLLDNITMMKAICTAIEQTNPAHVVYISSDAVYADSPTPLSETSCAQPGSLHGAMHLARELMLEHSCSAPLAILRPTLVYGLADPHNGYGPNRFRRLAANGEDIILFGEGEERRDHILVDDIADLVHRVLCRRSKGVLNLATGYVTSFRELAEKIVSLFDSAVSVNGSPRQGSMPHGGYRPFDSAGTKNAFPDFEYTPIEQGLALVHEQVTQQER